MIFMLRKKEGIGLNRRFSLLKNSFRARKLLVHSIKLAYEFSSEHRHYSAR